MKKLIAPIIALALSLFAMASLAEAQALDPILKSQFSTIPKFIEGALKALVIVALPVISLFIVYSGFLFVLARGNAEDLAKARRNFFWVIVGSILILGAWVLATLIGGTAAQLTNT